MLHYSLILKTTGSAGTPQTQACIIPHNPQSYHLILITVLLQLMYLHFQALELQYSRFSASGTVNDGPCPPPQVSVYEPTAIVPPQSFPLNAYPERQTMQQPNINPPINPPYPTEAIQRNSHVYTSYAYPAPEPQCMGPQHDSAQPPECNLCSSHPSPCSKDACFRPSSQQ
ncbi:hypothetical protein NQZ68_004831 [Dissostichus eleginoides]|nr:hypothetical protein NQZ68_004831 [Dissostichus eleginoides]